ncbi:MAG: desulfoferrodoxin [Clostridia bacterium]|nr:desulfoferrodoxin [Clostridia bacterium]
MNESRFYICKHCGNIIGKIKDAGVPMMCCGEVMPLISPNTVDASQEKHLPVASIDGNIISVEVGSVIHPSTEEHYIEWIYVQTEKGGQRKAIKPGEIPAAKFAIIDDKPLAVYAYCNLHGLWKIDL